jgi:hypothetical protein
MLIQQGRYVCALCGVQIDATRDQHPLTLIKASSGERNLRVIMLDGKELHACPIEPDAK